MDYARQRLSAAEAGAVDNHLGGCRNCVALLEQERSLCLVLESVPSVRARGDIWLAVRARRAAVALPASMAQARPCAISVRRSAWQSWGVALTVGVGAMVLMVAPLKPAQDAPAGARVIAQALDQARQVSQQSDNPLQQASDTTWDALAEHGKDSKS
jgi:hypothetical protein